MNACPHCGAELRNDETQCWNCGGNVAAGRPDTGHRQTPQPDPDQGQEPKQTGGSPQQDDWQQGPGTADGATKQNGKPAERQPGSEQPHRQVPAHEQVDRDTPERNRGQPGNRPRGAGTGGPSPPRQPPGEFEGSEGDGPLSRRQLLAGGGLLAAGAVAGWVVFLRGSGTAPGDSFESATVLPSGEYGPYEITDGERHYFAVDLREGERLTATISFDHTGGDLDFAVHSPDATEESNTELRTATSTDDDEEIRIVAQETGTYYLVPYGYRDNSNEYELTVEIEDRESSPDTPGTSVADAPLVAQGTHGPYDISGGEEHYFAVELDEGVRFSATISFDHDQADLDMAVDGPDGEQLGNSASTTDNETVERRVSRSGTHVVRVYPYQNGTATYTLDISVQ